MTGFGAYLSGFMAAVIMAVLNAPFGKASFGRKVNTAMLCVLSWIGAFILAVMLVARFLQWLSGLSK